VVGARSEVWDRWRREARMDGFEGKTGRRRRAGWRRRSAKIAVCNIALGRAW
jgi:hypothetical protein